MANRPGIQRYTFCCLPCALLGEMDLLTKLLFPNNPRMDRLRKTQVLYIAAFLVVAICATVGMAIFLLNQIRVK